MTTVDYSSRGPGIYVDSHKWCGGIPMHCDVTIAPYSVYIE